MESLRDIAPYVAIGAAALAVVVLILVVALLVRIGRLRRAQTVVLGHHEERDIVAHVEALDDQVRNLREAVEILTDELDGQKHRLECALTNRAIVRYDAFRDAGGEQSASFALLDQYRSGVVISAIAARDFARIYVKYITDGVADRDLSPEEVQAVEAAVPRPLKPGEEGPKARRAPLPEAEPPAGLRGAGADEPPGSSAGAAKPPGSSAAADEPPDPHHAAPSPEAAAAFEALSQAAAPGAPAGPAPEPQATEPRAGNADSPPAGGPDDELQADDYDDFTWEPPPHGGFRR